MERHPRGYATRLRRVGWLLACAIGAYGSHPATVLPQALPVYQPGEMQADLVRFRDALVAAHPSIHAHEPAPEFDAFFARLMNYVAVPRSSVEFHLVVMELTARLQDGHTRAFSMNATQQYIQTLALLPFHATVQNERIFVRRDLSDAALGTGSEILAIDGVPSNAILRKLEPFLGVDGGSRSGFYSRLGSNYNAFYHVFPLIFGVRPEYEVAVRDAGTGGLREVTVAGVNGTTFTRLERERYGKLLHVQSLEAELSHPALDLSVDRAGGHALLRIRRFFKDGFGEPPNAFPALLRDAFRQIARANVRALIIDLRANGGGIGGNAAHLIRYLSDSSFVPTAAITLRGDDAYYAPFTTDSLGLGEYFGLRRDDNLHVATASDRIVELQRFRPVDEDRFRGRLLVLIDGGTLSAAGMAAGLLQHYTNATFIGQETGGYAGMSNGIRQLAVRGLHTDSGIDIPLAHSEFSISPHRRTRGVLPDHTVTPSVNDLQSGRDAVLEFARTLLD